MATKLKLAPWSPSEHDETAIVVSWAAEMVAWKKFPELAGLYGIPNGTLLAGDYRHRAIQMARLKAEGLRPGVPDLCLPIARRGFQALYIEQKSTRKGAVASDEQIEWRRWLNTHGNHAAICIGAKQSIELLLWYVGDGATIYPKGVLENGF
jgi:hypothetical protein